MRFLESRKDFAYSDSFLSNLDFGEVLRYFTERLFEKKNCFWNNEWGRGGEKYYFHLCLLNSRFFTLNALQMNIKSLNV